MHFILFSATILQEILLRASVMSLFAVFIFELIGYHPLIMYL